jgi:thiamine biosynthesis protein ThiI
MKLLLVKYGEIALKGKNKSFFIDALVKQIKSALYKTGKYKVRVVQGRIFVSYDGETAEVIERLRRVFGIVGISPVTETASELEAIKEQVLQQLLDIKRNRSGVLTFKVETRRADKRFPIPSPEVSRILGAHLLSHLDDLKVDVHYPEVMVNVEIRTDGTFIYTDSYQGVGGLPIGVSGKAGLLLSGGIDSPVAGWMAMKRGVEVFGIHFHSYPFTSERAKEKVIDLGKRLGRYCGRFKIYIVPFTEIQKEIIQKCPEDFVTLIMRRYMMKIAEKITLKEEGLALITGESIGQVASQTLESMSVTSQIVQLPIFRPLIGFDKEETVEVAKKIGTYEISILPYEDCCTIFVPKHPATRPRLKEVLEGEKGIPWEELMEKAISEVEIIEV